MCHPTLPPSAGMNISVEDELQMQQGLYHVAQPLLNTGI